MLSYTHSSIPNIIICRLVLSLRQFSEEPQSGNDMLATLPEPRFASNRVLGNIGAPLYVSRDEMEIAHGICPATSREGELAKDDDVATAAYDVAARDALAPHCAH